MVWWRFSYPQDYSRYVMVFFFLSATLPSHTRWCFEYAGAALRQVRGGNWRWFTPITGGVNSISAGFTPDTWSIFKLWRFFISAKYTRYMVVFVIRRNSMGGVFHHLLGALPLFFWTFFVWKKKCHHICGGFYGNWRGDSPLSLILGRKEEERKKDWLWWRRCFLFGLVEKWRGNGLHTDYGRSPLLSLSVFIPKKWKDGVTGVSCGYRFLCDMAFSVLFLALFLLFYAGRRGFFLSVRMWRQQGLTHRFG